MNARQRAIVDAAPTTRFQIACPSPGQKIRDKAIAFSREWQDAESERAEAQTFWNEFFAVFGVPRRRLASFEEPVKKLGAQRGRIDAFWLSLTRSTPTCNLVSQKRENPDEREKVS